jgi:hypothetical protein
MRRQASVGFLILASLVACTHVTRGPSPATTGATSVNETPASVAKTGSAPPSRELPPAAKTAAPDAQTASGGEAARTEAVGAPVATAKPPVVAGGAPAPVKAGVAATAKTKPPSVDSAGTSPAAAPRTTPPATQETGAGTAQTPPSSAALDLTSLEQRLRDTRAIGLFTKLSVKNQVDDLLSEFRAFHGGRIPPTLADLRQRYDLLLLKVLTLLQDGDPPLASAVSSSRDAIWGILADRERFQRI